MLKVGIIGCGNIFTMHATSCNHLKTAELIGVCDIKKDRADKWATKYNVKAYYDYKEFLDNEKLDVVHICVPHYLHPVISKYALERGINVLCEKPMAINYEDALENVKIAKEKGVKYGIIFQCRFNDTSKLVKENLENGNLGKVLSARVVLTWCKPDEYYSLSDWKGTWDKEGGGVIIDQAIHSLDLANWFINDEPISVEAHLAKRGHSIIEVDDTGEGFIRYKNGASLSFWAMNNYACDEDIEIRLFCEKGTVRMSYDDAVIKFNDGKVLSVSQGAGDIVYEDGKDYWGFQHIRQIEDFYDAVINNRQPKITGESALKIQKLICEIYKKGRW